MSKLLVVDDEQTICWGLQRMGETIGHDVVTASSAEEGIEAADREKPDVIILDVRLPGMDGLTAIQEFRQTLGNVPIIVMTAYGDLSTAVRAVHSGAFEYIVKPFDLEQMQNAVNRALQVDRQPESQVLTDQILGDLVGRTPVMQEIFRRIALSAASDANVLISGESGTGKELAARAIHKFSRRADGPFVAVNVASFSSSLAESELFGHVRGAFTGAEQTRAGLLAQADGGTLFLDEVADIPLPVQVKLLRALEHGEVVPVGSDANVKTDFRVVAATHQDLLQRVKEGTFRHDLYFRLCAFEINLPPLRDRRDDIPELAEHFLNHLVAADDDGRGQARLAQETAEILQQRPWYGNVRELRNAVEHALVLARGGMIMPEHLPEPVSADAIHQDVASPDLQAKIKALVSQWAENRLQRTGDEEELALYDQFLSIIEPPLLSEALKDSGGQYSLAARKLGMHRTTLRKKLDQYEME